MKFQKGDRVTVNVSATVGGKPYQRGWLGAIVTPGTVVMTVSPEGSSGTARVLAYQVSAAQKKPVAPKEPVGATVTITLSKSAAAELRKALR